MTFGMEWLSTAGVIMKELRDEGGLSISPPGLRTPLLKGSCIPLSACHMVHTLYFTEGPIASLPGHRKIPRLKGEYLWIKQKQAKKKRGGGNIVSAGLV